MVTQFLAVSTITMSRVYIQPLQLKPDLTFDPFTRWHDPGRGFWPAITRLTRLFIAVNYSYLEVLIGLVSIYY